MVIDTDKIEHNKQSDTEKQILYMPLTHSLSIILYGLQKELRYANQTKPNQMYLS